MLVLVPGSWTVRRGHDLSEELERDIVEALPVTTVFVHFEPLEDEASFRDQGLDRPSPRDASGDVGGLRTRISSISSPLPATSSRSPRRIPERATR